MKSIARPWQSFLFAASTAIITACADTTGSSPYGLEKLSLAAKKDVDLGACEIVNVPAGNKLSSHVYANGVQIYRWNGTGWAFIAPEATLTADANGNGVVGSHYAGPTWESNSGSKVVGAVVERCTASPNAIPWLLLRATSSDGPGVFQRVTYIQRVNTVAGLAPTAPGSVIGEEARVPYTTEYFFYRSK